MGLLVGAIFGGTLLMVRFGGLPVDWFSGSDSGNLTSGQDDVRDSVPADIEQDNNNTLGLERGNAIVRATRRVAPAVVSINVEQAQQVRDPSMELWERMGLIPKREYFQHVQSMGSGVIVSDDGLVVTNAHVLEGALKVIVTLSDGGQYQARLVDIIDRFDLAVLQIQGSGFPVARFSQDDNLEIGEWAIAIGSPYGYLLADTQPTVTVGVISALNRDIKRSSGEREYLGMIQTDAAINPGNSGGPLVNTAGEVVGINTFIFSDNGGSVGIGFAVPSARVQQVLLEIRKFGHYREISLGFSLQKLSPGMIRFLGLTNPQGFYVVGVTPGSPAWKAGLRPKDVLRKVGGEPLVSADVLYRLVYEAQVGDSLSFKAERANEPLLGEIIIEEAQ